MFQHNIPYVVNLLLPSVEILVIITFLYETIKILHEKMLNAIYLHGLHNYTSQENNSLNGHTNGP